MKMNKKIISLLIISLLLATSLAVAQETAKGGFKNFLKSGELLSSEMRTLYFSVFILMMGHNLLREAETDLSTNIYDYILQNPPVYSEGFRSMIGFFISLIQPFYILAIILTAFYIMFVSDSYVKRSKAKSMLEKLIVGLIIMSFSLPLLWIFFGVSEAVTASILNQGMVDRAVEEYNLAMWESWKMMAYSIILSNSKAVFNFINGLPKEKIWITSGRSGGSIEYTKKWVAKWQTALNLIKFKGDPGRSIPFLMFFTVLFGGLYILISIRYVMTMIWALLFPLMIFCLSFDMTKRLGRTMVEQAVLWTVLQTFYALVFTTVGATLTVIPPDIYGTYAIKYHGVGEILAESLIDLSLFTLIACMVLYLGPVVLFNLFQKLFPP